MINPTSSLIVGVDVQAYDAGLLALATGSEFVVFSGPTASNKTFTLPNSDAVITTSAAALTSGRLPYATTGGQLLDTSALLYDTTNGISLPAIDGTYGLTVGNATNGNIITRDGGYRVYSSGQIHHLIGGYNGGVIFNERGGDFDTRFEGDSLAYMFFCDASAATENIALLTTAAPNWQSMDRGLFIGECSAAPTGNPSSGGFLYVEGGALKYRGTSGTVTTLGPA